MYWRTSRLPRLLVEPPWSEAAPGVLSTSLMSLSRLSVLLRISGFTADNLLSLSLGKLRITTITIIIIITIYTISGVIIRLHCDCKGVVIEL